MKLAEKLIYLRKEKGLSQLTLAGMMNVSRQAISRWETGVAVPSSENLIYLGNLYGVSLDYLFNDNEDEPVQKDMNLDKAEDMPGMGSDLADERRDKRKNTKWAFIAVALLALIEAIYIVATVDDESDVVSVNDVPKKVVEIEEGMEFDLEWFPGGE